MAVRKKVLRAVEDRIDIAALHPPAKAAPGEMGGVVARELSLAQFLRPDKADADVDYDNMTDAERDALDRKRPRA